jgi:DNA-binding winged helix-turn-helix (wHTH) protein/TolB-like protein/Tfp pilus assembly protein PilF
MGSNGNGKLAFGEFRLDPRTRSVWHQDEQIHLPFKASELLCLLVENRGEVVTKDEIWSRVWNDEFIEETNLTHNIYLLRKTFRDLGAGDLIKTVPRRGYRLAVDVRDDSRESVVYERTTVTDTLIEETTQPEPKPVFSPRIALAAAILIIAAIVGTAFLVNLRSPVVAAGKIESIAVLPFRTLNDPANSDSAGLGIADLLITRLSQVNGLMVRPTNSIAGMGETDAVAVGQKLAVDSVLEGAIYRDSGQIRITARLIKVSDAHIIWSGEFQKSNAQELDAHNELALHILDVVAANLGDEERRAVLRSYTGSIEALRLYERGRFEWNKRSTSGMVEAQRLFRNAVEKDPNFALAYCGLADTLAMSSNWHEAHFAVKRALEIDPKLGEAYASDGFIRMFRDWDWNGAEASFRRSLEINSGNATSHHWYATLLSIRGRLDEAKSEMQFALDINPVSYNYLADMGQLYYFSGEHETARQYCDRSLQINPDFQFAHEYLYFIGLKTGNFEQAIEEGIKADKINGTLVTANGNVVPNDREYERLRSSFRDKKLRGFLDAKYGTTATHPNSYYFFAIKHSLLGENRQAIEFLERASEARTFLTAFIKANPIFEDLHDEPRFQAILKKMAL